MVSAQGWGRGQMSPRSPSVPRGVPEAEAVTVSGSLVVAHGLPALKSGDVTYLLGGISRLVGFIDGLKEGAQVAVEGLALASPKDTTLKFLRASRLTLDNKTYDLALPKEAFGFAPRFHAPDAPKALPQRPYPRFNHHNDGRQHFRQRDFSGPRS